MEVRDHHESLVFGKRFRNLSRIATDIAIAHLQKAKHLNRDLNGSSIASGTVADVFVANAIGDGYVCAEFLELRARAWLARGYQRAGRLRSPPRRSGPPD